jgi:hypothetical protein
MSELKLVDLTTKKRKNVSKKESTAKKVVVDEVGAEEDIVEEVVKEIEKVFEETIPETVPETVEPAIETVKVKKPPTEKQLAAREAMKVKREAAKAEAAAKAKAEALILEREAEAAAKKAEEKKLKAAEKRRAKKEAKEAEEVEVLKPAIKPKKPTGKSIAEPFKNVETKVVVVEPTPKSLPSVVVPADYRRKKTNVWGKGTPFQGNKIF